MVPFDSVTPKTYEMTYYIHIPRLVNYIIFFDRSFWPPFWIFLHFDHFRMHSGRGTSWKKIRTIFLDFLSPSATMSAMVTTTSER